MAIAPTGQAIDFDQVPTAKRSASGLHPTALEAHEMKQKNPQKVLFIDIRTRVEIMHVGLPCTVDVNVPFLDFPEVWEWSDASSGFIQMSNTRFVPAIEVRLAKTGLGRDDPIILICRSGIRSAHAAGLHRDRRLRR